MTAAGLFLKAFCGVADVRTAAVESSGDGSVGGTSAPTGGDAGTAANCGQSYRSLRLSPRPVTFSWVW